MSMKEEEQVDSDQGCMESILDPYIPKITKSLHDHLSAHFDEVKLNQMLRTLARPVRFDVFVRYNKKNLKNLKNRLNEASYIA